MATFTDDFNRANTSDLGAGWVEVSGDWAIDTNRLSPGAGGGTIILRAAGAMDSNDHYAQVTIAATTAASHGVWCRGDGTLSSGYLWRNDGSTWDLFSVVGGSFTNLGTYAAAAAPGDVARVQAVGSTIKAYVNGIERVSLINNHVTTGTSVGIRGESTNSIRYDDFTAADVTAGAALGTAAETDSAQALTGVKAGSLGAAESVESGQPLAGAKASTLAPTAEQDTAQALAASKAATLGTAGALETAMPLTGSKTATLGTALEVDTARPLTTSSTTVPSPERTYQIPAESRRLVVVAENRTLTVRR